ncbi:MAG: hypothetical protein KIS92_01410 [Planctomycetota bacterium]|nr:hypothetical protein [Planctomycetota bacterium]
MRLLHAKAWLAVVAATAVLTHSILSAEDAPGFVWIEGEQPASSTVSPKLGGWGKKEFLSGESWAHVSLPPEEVEKLPDDGALLAYAFKAAKDGEKEIWARIGFEFVRSPFEWRIDAQPWKRVDPDVLTTDLYEVDVWCEVAWLKLGMEKLAAGDHKLEFRLLKTQDDKKKTARILFALDAVCISDGPFYPNGLRKPGEDAATEADRKAAANVFALPAPKGEGLRSSVELSGAWEICRFDEDLPGPDVAQPIQEFPKHPFWSAIQVPGDKNKLRPDLVFCHRFWYRTKVNVPAEAAGRSFYLEFPENNLNTTVYVNGVYCGFNKNPFARFRIDVTKGVKAGQANEVWVGMRDAWYGYSTNPNDPMKLRKKFNIPLDRTEGGFQELAYPIWHHFQSGMLLAPVFTAAGPVYADDVFPNTSVAKKQIALEITLKGSEGAKAAGEIVCEAVNAKTGAVEKTFAAKAFETAEASQTLTLTEPWENPKLWWPDEPNLYKLRATVKVGGKVADISETTFGFREWTSEGKDFKLNGLVWHGWADCFTAKSPEDWIAFYRKSNQRVMRFWGTRWQGLAPEAALDFFDREGVVVRRSGTLDGEAIGYMAIEKDPDLAKESPIKMDLMRNWRDQQVARVLGERNHPSVMVWSIENEYLYINCINLYGGLMDHFEAEITKTSEAVLKADPTRFTMVDGGGATKANTLPVHGDHYVFGGRSGFGNYPDLAYEDHEDGGGRGRWHWDLKRPRFIGEDYFANGINPFEYSYFGGEETFQGKAQSRRAAGIIYRNLTEGYRWAGYGAWHFWMGQHEALDQYNSNAPVAVFCRQWDWTFTSGKKIARSMKVFNDTRFDEPIEFRWTLDAGGTKTEGEAKTFKIAPGGSEAFAVELAMPEVAKRTEGTWTLTLKVKGQEVFRDVKAVSVLPEAKLADYPALAKLGEKDLLVYDPQGNAAAFLKDLKQPFTALTDLKSLPDAGQVLVVGKDALTPIDCASSALQGWAVAGRRVVVLEQQHPLRYLALPADVDVEQNEGRTAFLEDLNHPVARGLDQKDFYTWGPEHIVYRNAYGKPSHGGKSLVQCHQKLQNTALLEMPVGEGLLCVTQLTVGEKLPGGAVPRKLFLNLLEYAAGYKLQVRSVAACVQNAPDFAAALKGIGMKFTEAPGPLDVLGENKIAVLNASPANLKTLAENQAKVDAYCAGGGWIVLNGLTPESLADYNKVVGVNHLIRPFRMERVTFPASKHPLTAGLTTADIVMQSGKRINTWTRDVYLASDEFSYVLDYDDIAPFAAFPDPKYFKYDEENPENDHNPLNMVNGFVSADSWKYIFSIPLGKGSPHEFTLTWPVEEEIVEIEWTGNAMYHIVTKLDLIFDGDREHAVSFKTEPNNEPQTFAVEPARKGKALTLNLAEWAKVGRAEVLGVDNLRIKAKRSDDFYARVKPLLNIGGMLSYAKGSGGILLCNVAFLEREAVPENAAKKRNILAALLRNLQAPFGGAKTVVAGSNLDCQPVDISKFGTQYRDDRGWFGDKRFTFKDLPTGRQKFAGVTYQVYDFATSQVPTVIMLGGKNIPNKPPEEVKDIPVGRKADAVFFLHTARLDQRRNPKDLKEDKKYEMLRYVVTYADGQTAGVPVYAEIDIHDYRQKTPAALPGAQLGWTAPYEGTDQHAVAYSMQWNNPRPDVEIKSIDVVYGEQRRGVPVVLAITTAKAP